MPRSTSHLPDCASCKWVCALLSHVPLHVPVWSMLSSSPSSVPWHILSACVYLGAVPGCSQCMISDVSPCVMLLSTVLLLMLQQTLSPGPPCPALSGWLSSLPQCMLGPTYPGAFNPFKAAVVHAQIAC